MSDTLVLCYHAVSAAWAADLSVTPTALTTQLEALRRQGYRGVTFGEAVHAPDRGRRVAVTFDDAFRSVLSLAKPALDRLGWPGTIFAVTDHAERGAPLAWEGTDRWMGTPDEPEMEGLGYPELRRLAEDGWEVGSHTATHPFLTRLDDEALHDELTRSRAALTEALGEPCDSIAYPYGDWDERVADAAHAAGYARAATLPARWPAPRQLAWPRVGVYHTDDLRRFRIKVSPSMRGARRMLGR